MSGNYTITTRTTGEILTAAKYNADHQNHVDNNNPAGIGDLSSGVTAMQATVDPGEVGSESLATSLEGEHHRLRHIIKEITGEDQWYVTPTLNLNAASNFGNSAQVSLTSFIEVATGRTAISWRTENYDDSGFWASGTPDTFTIPAGVTKVQLHAGIHFSGLPGEGDRIIDMIKNGGSFPGQPIAVHSSATNASTDFTITSPILEVTSGDAFKLRVANTASGGGTVKVNAVSETWWGIVALK